MTKLWIDEKHVPVTLLKLMPQEVINHRTEVKDWYDALVVWMWKKELDKERWEKVKYSEIQEFKVSADMLEKHKVWDLIDLSVLEWIESITLKSISKWKWFQWYIKRHWFAEWPKTHWSKFHRTGWSTWCRKPRRVDKGKKLPGHMWLDLITVKNVQIVDRFELENEFIIAVKWSVPGFYWSVVRLEIK